MGHREKNRVFCHFCKKEVYKSSLERAKKEGNVYWVRCKGEIKYGVGEMSYMNISLSGNFQYDAGVLGFLKVLERFYPAQYEVSGGELKFTRKVLDDFNLSWFKMILLQSDIFNNSIYRPNAKKRQNKRYRDEIKKVISDFAKLEDIGFEERYGKLNLNIHQAIQKAKSVKELLEAIERLGKEFLAGLIEDIKKIITTAELNDKERDKKLKALEGLKVTLEEDVIGRVENVKKGTWVRKIVMPFNFNKGMFNVGAKESLLQMVEKFKSDFIQPIFQLEEATEGDINCDFCGKYKVKIDFDKLNKKKGKTNKQDNVLDRTHLFGVASRTTFSNIYWFGQPSIFFCDLCELIMLCAVFGFNDKEKNSDLDKANKIFIHAPSLEALKKLNVLAEKQFSFETFFEKFLDRVDLEKQRMKYVLENILFVELQAEGQNTSFQALHIPSPIAEFIVNNYNLLKNIKGKVFIQKGNNTVSFDVRYELLKRILSGQRDIQDLIVLIILEAINKETMPDIFFKGLALVQYRLGGGKMEDILHRFYEEGCYFSNKLSEWNKKREVVYSLLQTIRGNDKNSFLDKLFLLYISYQKEVPREIDLVVRDKVAFHDVGNAFIAGILNKVPDKAKSNLEKATKEE